MGFIDLGGMMREMGFSQWYVEAASPALASQLFNREEFRAQVGIVLLA